MARISVLEVTKLGWDLSWKLNAALGKTRCSGRWRKSVPRLFWP